VFSTDRPDNIFPTLSLIRLTYTIILLARPRPDHEMMGEEDNTNASSKRQPYQDVPISTEVGLSRSSGRHAGDVTGSSRNPSPRAVQNPQSKNFEIVLVTDNESRRQVRRHAMRQYMRQRRLDSIARLETPRLPIGGWVSRQVLSEASSSSIPPSPVEVPVKDTSPEEEKLSPVKDGEPCTPECGIGPLMPLASRSSEVKAEEPSSPSFPIVSYTLSGPLSSPGHGAVEDPFSCYPIPVSHSDHELIQHCKFFFGSQCSHTDHADLDSRARGASGRTILISCWLMAYTAKLL
jgi:hypothetical protein